MQNELLYENNCTRITVGQSGLLGNGSISSNSSQQQVGCVMVSCRETSYTSVESLRSDESCGIQRAMTLPTNARYNSHLLSSTNLHIRASPNHSADSLTDTSNSSFATPPFSISPVGESHGVDDHWARMPTFDDADLPLPEICLVQLPPPRELTIQRRQKSPRQDFGFSLRKSVYLDRTGSVKAPVFKSAIFAEPRADGGATGLLPGDRLLKVNNVPVDDLTREVVIEMIRNSGDTITVEVNTSTP